MTVAVNASAKETEKEIVTENMTAIATETMIETVIETVTETATAGRGTEVGTDTVIRILTRATDTRGMTIIDEMSVTETVGGRPGLVQENEKLSQLRASFARSPICWFCISFQ